MDCGVESQISNYFSILIEISFGSATPATTCIDLNIPIGTAHPEQQPFKFCNGVEIRQITLLINKGFFRLAL
ncbi:MAG: hypothetical protein M1308_17650 [Actinobacteria bacterium]|nr:hypothetical protein [Actinomycetota bacterium]